MNKLHKMLVKQKDTIKKKTIIQFIFHIYSWLTIRDIFLNYILSAFYINVSVKTYIFG